MTLEYLNIRLHNVKKFGGFYLKNSKIEKKEIARLIETNKVYKDLHIGERCFILGNGPSLKQENLNPLTNEIVFTVNQACRNPQYEIINPTYHFWADAAFFDSTLEVEVYEELMNTFKSVKKGNVNPECFFPTQQYKFLVENELEKLIKCNYFDSRFMFYEGYNKRIDYCKGVPGFGTVVQWCITMAVYMGFSEIYLLGCDNTGLITTIKSALKSNDENDYVYSITENEKKRMEGLLEKQTIENYTKAYLNNIREYRYLYEYCSKKGINLINCSSTTVIDSIPRMRLEDVVKMRL